MTALTLADFDFALPPELIAQHPAPERSASRLLDGRGPTPIDRAVVLREDGFIDIPPGPGLGALVVAERLLKRTIHAERLR